MMDHLLVSVVLFIFVLVRGNCSYLSRLTEPRFSRRVFLGLNLSTDALVEALPELLKNGYSSDDSTFPYYDTSIASLYSRFTPEFDVVHVESARIFGTTHDHPDQYLYYSGNIMSAQFVELRAMLNISDLVSGLIPDPHILSKVTANTWMGMAGVQATAHYDAVYNVYAHFHGVKVFRLLPPVAVHALQVHGRMHPYACQSRLKSISTGELFQRPPFCIASDCSAQLPPTHLATFNVTQYMDDYASHIIEVEMHPGDVLVISPFWFHEVASQTAALSVSLWWDAKELDVMDVVYALPLPLESDWDAIYLETVGQVFVARLLDAACVRGVQSARALLAGVADAHEMHIRTQLLSPVRIVQLIIVRYQEDWLHRGGANVNQSRLFSALAAWTEEINISVDESMRQKINAAADQRAVLFCDGFLSEENFVPESSLFRPADGANTSCNRSTETSQVDISPAVELLGTVDSFECTSTVRKAVENQLAVLSIKLTDYIEDVFLQVAGMVRDKQCKQSTGNRELCSKTKRLPYELAVTMLLDWVQSVTKSTQDL